MRFKILCNILVLLAQNATAGEWTTDGKPPRASEQPAQKTSAQSPTACPTAERAIRAVTLNTDRDMLRIWWETIQWGKTDVYWGWIEDFTNSTVIAPSSTGYAWSPGAVSTVYTQSIEGMAAYYKLNDASATTTVSDELGAHNGTLQQNTDTLSVPGKLNTGLHFDGSTYVDCGQIPPLYDFTMTIWFRQDYPGADCNLFGTGVIGLWDSCVVAGMDPSGFQTILLIGGVYEYTSAIPIEGLCNDTAWHLFALCRNSAQRGYDIYMDGILLTHSTPLYDGDDTGVPLTCNNPFWIGYNGCWGWYHFTGDLDDLRIYGRTLASNEVAALAQTPAECVGSVVQSNMVLNTVTPAMPGTSTFARCYLSREDTDALTNGIDFRSWVSNDQTNWTELSWQYLGPSPAYGVASIYSAETNLAGTGMGLWISNQTFNLRRTTVRGLSALGGF